MGEQAGQPPQQPPMQGLPSTPPPPLHYQPGPMPQPQPQPQPPRVWPTFVLYVALLIGGTLIASVAFLAAAYLLAGPDALSTGLLDLTQPGMATALLISLATTVTLVGSAGVVAAILSPQNWWRRLRLNGARVSLMGYFILVVGAAAISWMFGHAVDLLGVPEGGTLKLISDFIMSLSGLQVVAAVLVIGLGAGIGEELFYRGYMQTRLTQRWGPRWSILLTALLFGVMHMDPVQGTFAFAFGLFLGYMTERTGSIRPAIACHVGSNSIAVLGGVALGAEAAEMEGSVIVVAVTFVIFVLSLWYVTRLRGRAAETVPPPAPLEPYAPPVPPFHRQ